MLNSPAVHGSNQTVYVTSNSGAGQGNGMASYENQANYEKYLGQGFSIPIGPNGSGTGTFTVKMSTPVPVRINVTTPNGAKCLAYFTAS